MDDKEPVPGHYERLVGRTFRVVAGSVPVKFEGRTIGTPPFRMDGAASIEFDGAGRNDGLLRIVVGESRFDVPVRVCECETCKETDEPVDVNDAGN